MENLDFFKDLEDLADDVWREVYSWPRLAQRTIGEQLVRAIDSAGANMVEGDPRFSDRESLHFFSIARGSAREARYWLKRSCNRSICPSERGQSYIARLESVGRRMNALITTRRTNLKQVRETRADYDSPLAEHGDPLL